jgi:hypothetical protein
MLGSSDTYKAFGANAPLSESSEKRASTLRDWYRIGQSYFRGFMNPGNHLENLNDAIQLLSNKRSPSEVEGFLMGWQSDVYAYENGLDFSVEGTESVRDDEQDYGYIAEDEGRSVLVESGIVGHA